MDFLQTLLSFVVSVIVALGSLAGGAVSDEQNAVVVAPPAVTHTTATTSSQSIVAVSNSTALPTKPAPKKSPAQPIVTVPAKTETPSPSPTPILSADALNTQTRGALVNILCLSKGGGVHSISGSGVFIDNRGVILTNAHIGQYFLLKDYPSANNVDCTIRMGSPAIPRYRATLVYLPPDWVADNAAQLTAQAAKGTGENDYAFLLVTGTTGPEQLPSNFPNLPMTTAEPATGDAAFLAAYPAGFLDGSTIEKSLYPTSAYATVKDLYTFGDGNDVDLVSIGGTIVSQGGSSGGAEVRASDGKLQGILATATAGATTADRDLRAVTISFIDRSLKTHGKGGFISLLSQNLTQEAADFATTVAPGELQLLKQALEHPQSTN